jgi:hypothetical protein
MLAAGITASTEQALSRRAASQSNGIFITSPG